MLLMYGSIIILKIKLVIAFKIWIGNNIQSLNFGSLIQSCQIGVLEEPHNSIYFGLKHQFDQLWMSEPKLNFGCHC